MTAAAKDLKSRILAAEDRPFEDLDVPEWGVKVRLRGMSGTDRDAWEAKAVALKRGGQDVELSLADWRSRLVTKCLFDPETDERIFTDGEVSKLGAKAATVIERLFGLARRLSGLDDDAEEEADAVDGDEG